MAKIRPPPGILDSVDVTSEKEISCQVRNRFEHIGSFDLPPYGQPAHIVYLAGCWKLCSNQLETNNRWGDIMTDNSTQDYFDDKSEGHVDTREANFKCENPDKHLGCDLGIDVMG